MIETVAPSETTALAPEVKVFWDQMAGLSGIEGLLVRSRNGMLYLWPVVDQPDRDLQDAIYQAEWALMDSFREGRFDFHVLARFGQPLSEVVSLDDFDAHLGIEHA